MSELLDSPGVSELGALLEALETGAELLDERLLTGSLEALA